MKSIPNTASRRRFIKTMAACSATMASAKGWSAENIPAPSERRFLFVIGANGGASIVDSFLPILDTESSTGINTFTASQIQQINSSNFRCPKPMNNLIQNAIPLGDGYDMSNFLSKHSQDMAVMTQQCSSVNHQIASRRSVTGNDINAGRTLQEAVAMQYGMDLLLPNANMASTDYGGEGNDKTLAPKARPEIIADPRFMAFATHGHKGINNAPNAALIARARQLRQQLDQTSEHRKAFNARPKVANYLHNRDTLMPQLESAELINKLLLLKQSPNGQPLSDYALEQSQEAETLFSYFPNLQNDPFEAQTALAYLLIKSGISCTATIEPSDTPYINPAIGAVTSPLAFDWSHIDHRGAQNAMWGRVMNMTDKLISLLKNTEFGAGQSLWDRSFIYIATDFGREKVSEGGSGHDLNNGNVLLSPFIKGNRVYGGINPDTAHTYGFDRITGEATPNQHMDEGDVYSAVCHAMNIDFDGRRDMPVMIKNS